MEQKTQFTGPQTAGRETRVIKLNKLNSKQNSLLQSTLAGVSGVSLGALLMSYIPRAVNDLEGDDPMAQVEDGTSAEITIDSNTPFADIVSDDMSFSEAFAAARDQVGAGGLFEWHGQTYNTFYEDEWQDASADLRDNHLNSLDSNHLNADVTEESEILDILNDVADEISEIDILNDSEDVIIDEVPDASEQLYVIDDSGDDSDDSVID